MTPLTKDINATDFVRDLNDALRYLEVGLVGGGSSSLRSLTTDMDAQQFVTDINYNLGISKIFGAKVLNNLNPDWANAVNLENIDKTKQNMFMVTLGYKFL